MSMEKPLGDVRRLVIHFIEDTGRFEGSDRGQTVWGVAGGLRRGVSLRRRKETKVILFRYNA
jgi:hypothetical protein